MIEIPTRRFPLLNTKEIWFYNNESLKPVDKNLFYQALEKPEHVPFREFDTLVTNLRNDESVIFSDINRTFRYHIRKALKLTTAFDAYTDVPIELSRLFLASHKRFAKSKQIFPFSTRRFSNLEKSGHLCLTILTWNNKPSIFHCYLIGSKKARLLTSHAIEVTDETQRGYLNKLHHWNDLLHFKSHGYIEYDWGGIDYTSGRSFFKQSFGGEPKKYFNYETNTGIVQVINRIKKVWK